ncbi:MAG: PASTA domain-containing protein [Cellulomonas sp.]|nr:PASTA domain-containing protein [Cellulomonas sp.]
MAGTNRRAAQPSGRSRSRVAATPKRPRRFFDYPRHGFHGLHRWLPSWRFLLGGFLTVCFLGLGAVVAAYALTPIPDPAKDTATQASTVYFANNADGTRGTAMGTFAVQRREIVDFATLPAHVGNAVVAGEDRTFWDNSGVSITGTGRALLNNLRGGSLQGGSTLTQQYAHRYYATRSTRADYVGKFKEAILAIKIARDQDKKVVLGNYLNTIYFGRDSYGIQVAARSFFGVDAKDLTLSQSAVLAGIIPSPNNWDPAKSPDKAQAKWKIVLDAMLTDKAITQAEHDDAVQKGMPATVEYKVAETYQGVNGYILQRVRTELTATGAFTDDTIDGGGLTIITTIEKPVQDEAVRAVGGLLDGTLAGAQPSPQLKVALVSIRPKTGAIVSMYGGPDPLTDAVNRVTLDAVQAGSTFKPFALIAALQQGVPLTTRFNGNTPQKFGDWSVHNFEPTQFGSIDLVTATAQSVNTVYAQLNLKIGPDKTAGAASQAGVTTTPDSNRANVLGTDAVHPLDMASAYATIAAQGTYSTPFIVSEVRYLKDDSVAYKGEKAHEQRFAADVMADTTFAMQQVVQSGSGKQWVKPLGRPIAGKTGTSETNQSAWFVGFTPEISTAVALSQAGGASGHDQVPIDTFGKPGSKPNSITGGTWPAALWASYMKPVLAMAPYATQTPFPARANVGGAPTATSIPTPTPTDTAPPVVTPAPVTQIAVPTGLEGKLLSDAEAAVLNAGLQPAVTKESSATVPAGKVVRVDPAAGAMLAPQGTVTLVVSTGPPPVATPIPTVVPTPSATPTVAPAA